MGNASKLVSYTFHQINNCNMCGSPAEDHDNVGQRLNCSQGLDPRSKRGIAVSILKCNFCNLVYANPQPIPNDDLGHNFISAWSDEYFIYQEDYFSKEINKVKKILNFKPGMKALDIGAGIGKGLRSLEKEGFDSYGIEPSSEACRIAYEKMSISPHKLQCAKIENSDFPQDFFDFVCFGAVLEHVYNPAECLVKALQSMKQGGILFAEVPNSRYFITKLINFYNKLNLTNYTSHISPMHAPFHHFEFDVKSFDFFCERNSCEIVAIDVLVCNTMFVPKIIVPFIDKYMEYTKTGMQLSIYLRKTL